MVYLEHIYVLYEYILSFIEANCYFMHYISKQKQRNEPHIKFDLFVLMRAFVVKSFSLLTNLLHDFQKPFSSFVLGLPLFVYLIA